MMIPPDPEHCECCACRGIHCMLPHPGHNHRLERPLTETELLFENLQDALLRVEWVRNGTGKGFHCHFCGGVSIEYGGDDHTDDCEWVRLTSARLPVVSATPDGAQQPEPSPRGDQDHAAPLVD